MLGGLGQLGVGGQDQSHGVVGDVARDRDFAYQALQLEHARRVGDDPRRSTAGASRPPTISASSVRLGKPTVSLKKKRSSSASGRGKVPSSSIGFWVASTKKGRGRSWLVRPTVTACSCIASSSADWVRGVARLISSASTRLAKTGPRWKSKPRGPSVLPRVEQHVGASHVGWHQVGRELDAAVFEAEGTRDGAHQERLAEAGQAFEQHVAAGQQRDGDAANHVGLPDDDAAHLLLERLRRSLQAIDLGPGAGRRLGHWPPVPLK